jgi:hypothetical protein
VYALAALSSGLKGKVVDTAPSVPTLEVVVVAPSRKEREHRREIAVFMAKKMKLPRVHRLWV